MDEEVAGDVIAGGFADVRIFLTDGAGDQKQWIDTKMIGSLKIEAIGSAHGTPIFALKLYACNMMGVELAKVFEYELPLNFIVQKLSETFTSFPLLDQNVGFLFSNTEDHEQFTSAILDVQ